ncbi:MAG: AAA family ATPase [Bacteroidota bacterium]
MKTYALYNLKGGVGKTTSSINLAYLAAKEGYKTLLWDLDPQGASSFILKQKTKVELSDLLLGERKLKKLISRTDYKNLFILPSNLANRHLDTDLKELARSKKQFKSLLSDVKSEFDYVFIDCPPSLGLAAENVFRAADFILIPMIPAQLSEYSLDQVIAFFKENKHDDRKLIPFFNAVDLRRKLHADTIERFKNTKRKILNSFIPYSSNVEKMGLELAPVQCFSSKSKAATSYRNLWQELKWFRKLK